MSQLGNKVMSDAGCILGGCKINYVNNSSVLINDVVNMYDVHVAQSQLGEAMP